MTNYLDMFLTGGKLLLKPDGKYHLLYSGNVHPLSLQDALRITRHASSRKERSNVWVRRKPRFRGGRAIPSHL